jgi:alkyl sulfatase BDS1-like metallo-beta-lactamase superfamily hydrolase
MPGGVPPRTTGPDTIRGMSTELWLDYIGILVDSRKAEGMKFTINLITPDNGEKFAVEMSNSTLTTLKGQQAKNADLTVTLNRADLETVMGGKATFDGLVAAGKAKFEGDRKPFDQLRSTLVQFAPDFELMPGTKPGKVTTPPAAKDPFEVIQSDTKGVP